ncbi:cobalamin 5'-phosphate synthase [Roseobacter sp. SK209-2-6]|uniref:adenosylcobinamide-GDP ribazoletransferase n=1 Tax=Roseobacter sp. SK209-2-6 TaxID=388739 RepID=UPI0000F3EF56|nr:adenosylcobinamide-GDP ribazoletransferase [Roseobacter sp. SK209-2-6]EBA16605.1 cobalamin 5'-phosphate synthase [Roseobacter sp. SK209-2-6]
MRKNDISPVDIPLALVLLTRLPIPTLSDTTFQRQSRAVWAFPLAGLAVSLPACLLAWLALSLGLSPGLAAGLFIALQVLLTGAMHEDGLADCADGFWGGFDRDRRLEIMKDSQIGTYGVLALILVLGLRWQALTLLLEAGHLWLLPALAMLSRAFMPLLMAALPNARQSGLSQSVGRPEWRAGLVGLGLALTFSVPLLGASGAVVLLIMALAAISLAQLARNKIGGQTGDVLGACQQLCELVGLLALVALLH